MGKHVKVRVTTVAVRFSYAFNLLQKWLEFHMHVTERSKAKPMNQHWISQLG